jgi:hypothetical protein
MDLVPIDRIDAIKAAFLKSEPAGLTRDAVRLIKHLPVFPTPPHMHQQP